MKRQSSAILAGCAIAAIGLAGCTTGHDDSQPSPSSPIGSGSIARSTPASTPTARTTAAPTSKPVSKPAGKTPIASLTLPPSISNVVAKRKSVVLSTCAADGAGWKASGTASNPGTAPVRYNITVFFTNQHATVQNYAVTDVTVAPGKTQPWSARKDFAAAPKSICVLRGVG
jgi:hypothetical protein